MKFLKLNSHLSIALLSFHFNYEERMRLFKFPIFYQGITKPKQVRKFKGEGMPLHFNNKKGDLYVAFEVLFPTSLTEDQKKKIKEILV